MRQTYTIRLIFLFLLFYFFQTSPAQCTEDSTQAFSSISVRLKTQQNVNRNLFHDYWEAETGLDLSASMPFYWGTIEGGLLLMPFDGKNESTPDFWNSFFYLSYGKKVQLTQKLESFGAFRVGSYQMHFDDQEINETQQTESELAAGLNLRVSYQVLKNCNVNIEGLYLKIYTYKPVELSFVGIGVSYRLSTPIWLREFLR